MKEVLIRHRTIGVLTLLGATVAGCSLGGSSQPAEAPVAHGGAVREDTRMTLEILDQHCMAFGERYVNAFRNATDQIAQKTADLEIRANAHLHKLRTATSVYEILSGPSPFAKIMDLVLLVELQFRVWVTDKVAAKEYGGAESAKPLVSALVEARADVWRVANLVLKSDQKKVMEEMIDTWRQRNPEAEAVASVRFNEFSEYRGKSILDNVPLGSGLLAPVSEATRQIQETRMLAERGLYLAKRMPQLVRWQAEAFLNTALLHPESRKLTDTAQRAVAVAESLPAKFAEERAIILKTMDDHEKAVGKVAADVRVIVADVKDIAKDAHALLDETKGVLKAAENLADKLSPPDSPKSTHPFDIREYGETIRESLKAVHEARGLLESDAWSQRVSEVNLATQNRVSHATEAIKSLLNKFFWSLAALIVLVFALMAAYRVSFGRPAPK